MTALAHYAKLDPGVSGNRCWGCAQTPKLRKEIEDGFLAGIPVSVILRWLQSEGADGVTIAKLTRHLKEHIKCPN